LLLIRTGTFKGYTPRPPWALVRLPFRHCDSPTCTFRPSDISSHWFSAPRRQATTKRPCRSAALPDNHEPVLGGAVAPQEGPAQFLVAVCIFEMAQGRNVRGSKYHQSELAFRTVTVS
jgi:hypothetical protein